MVCFLFHIAGPYNELLSVSDPLLGALEVVSGTFEVIVCSFKVLLILSSFLLNMQLIATVPTRDVTPNFETVGKCFELHASSGVNIEQEGTFTIAVKGSTFVPKSWSARVCVLSFHSFVSGNLTLFSVSVCLSLDEEPVVCGWL